MSDSTSRLAAINEIKALLLAGLPVADTANSTAMLDIVTRALDRLEAIEAALSSEDILGIRDSLRRLSNAIGTTIPVSIDTVALPAGAATEAGHLATIDATLALIKAKTDNLDVALSTRTKPADPQHVVVDTAPTTAVTGPLTDTQLRATPVPISGTVAVSNLPATQPVSGAVGVSNMIPAVETGLAKDASLATLATAARQDSGNTSVASLDAKTPAIGPALMTGSRPVVIASDQDSISDRYRRQIEEQMLLETSDVGSLACLTRSAREKPTLSDRRGRTTRGLAR